jgi:hypothetical protein
MSWTRNTREKGHTDIEREFYIKDTMQGLCRHHLRVLKNKYHG